jgi:hypothetical protein
MKLPTRICIRAAGLPSAITTVEGAVAFIDHHLHPELAKLPRWTFARALFVEVTRTKKSRDMSAAIRQFKQAQSNEKWLADKQL